jgi:hypothetical protein
LIAARAAAADIIAALLGTGGALTGARSATSARQISTAGSIAADTTASNRKVSAASDRAAADIAGRTTAARAHAGAGCQGQKGGPN